MEHVDSFEFGEIKREVDAKTYGTGFPSADWLNNTRKSPGKYALAKRVRVGPQRREIERKRFGTRE